MTNKGRTRPTELDRLRQRDADARYVLESALADGFPRSLDTLADHFQGAVDYDALRRAVWRAINGGAAELTTDFMIVRREEAA